MLSRKSAGICLMVLTMAPLLTVAQSVYIRSSAGYGFPTGTGQELQLDGYPYTGTGVERPGTFIYRRSGASLAAVVTGSLAAGIQLREQFALELSVHSGLKNRHYTHDAFIRATKTAQVHINHYADRPLLLIPSLVWMNSGQIGKPYARLGLVLPLSRRIFTETHAEIDTVRHFDKREISTAFSVGVCAAAGYFLPVTKHLAITAEASFILLSLRVRQANLIESTANGRDVLPGRSRSHLQVNYSQAYNPQFIPPDEPSLLPEYKIPFSSLNISAGISVSLN